MLLPTVHTSLRFSFENPDDRKCQVQNGETFGSLHSYIVFCLLDMFPKIVWIFLDIVEETVKKIIKYFCEKIGQNVLKILIK